MRAIDNIYVLNYLVNRQLNKGKGKMIAFFVDLRATFDSDREILLKTMRERNKGGVDAKMRGHSEGNEE